MSQPQPVSSANKPRHVAIIMDGNGRWAQHQSLPRSAGHRAGVKAARQIVEACGRREIEVLTLFAFSSENWNRPKKEVGLLMRLFVEALQREVDTLNKNNVRLEFIGDRQSLSSALQKQIIQAEQTTRSNTGLHLIIAVAYGGEWDIVEASRRLASRAVAGELDINDIDKSLFRQELSLSGVPDPDLFIRTGGERRISNFLLWNLAYTELYFTDHLWPDFGVEALDEALDHFATRQRRFGQVPGVKPC
ncbi:MAG: polyprenyl diphosphate synthase [Pseudomonadota bacterium]